MTLKRFELIAAFAVVLCIAGYGWYSTKDSSEQIASAADTVAGEISTLSGLKVAHQEFAPKELADPYTHLAVNGETWFSQTGKSFNLSKSLFEFPDFPADAWYAPANASASIQSAWDAVKSTIEQYFPESK